MNTGRLLAWVVLPLVGLVVAGALAIWLLKALLGLAVYLLVGAAVVAGGVLLYRKVRRAVGPGSRNRRRLEAAAETYRARKRY
jgi:O-antigen/teichoic acid export membrane protein